MPNRRASAAASPFVGVGEKNLSISTASVGAHRDFRTGHFNNTRQRSVKIGARRDNWPKQHQFENVAFMQQHSQPEQQQHQQQNQHHFGVPADVDVLNTSRSARVREAALKAKRVANFGSIWKRRSVASRDAFESKVREKQSAHRAAEVAFAKTKDTVRSTAQEGLPDWLREVAALHNPADGVLCCVNVALIITRDAEDADGFKPSKRLAYKWADARRALKKKSPALVDRLLGFDPLTLTPAMLTSLEWYLANPNFGQYECKARPRVE